ncbi:MAG: dihydropteroate synthase [Methanoregulaceae archaeon]|nr:dihydropteroate synthase [Methanoregulaceae archaeon]
MARTTCTVNKKTIGDGSVTLMGVINCSPESFFSASYVPPGQVRERAMEMAGAGAAIIDLGARSTAPGSPPLSVADEKSRMESALSSLDGTGLTVSVDTLHPEVLEACLSHEVHAINDISGLSNPAYSALAGDSGLPVFAMASRSLPGDALSFGETLSNLSLVAGRCEEYGIRAYVLDPGIGRWVPERTAALDIELCRRFSEFRAFGKPLLAAVSRKSFIGEITGRPPEGRLPGSLAVTTLLLPAGADVVRTHDVGPTLDAVRSWMAVKSG